ncbi:unnamed protein product [Gongylonema pulchrum]|uniref:Mediator of RNA polymerase II transcription subunit 7 n=1 Tax=Gongylonema pulchrum TaxID=637853 RepID=A0A183ERG2_9BILA|nr:unnamed protein product [Gongylonema pulchrum]
MQLATFPAPLIITASPVDWLANDCFDVLTQAVFDDFFEKCAESEDTEEPANLVALFCEICNDAISAIRKVSQRPERTAALKSVLEQLVHEKQAYTLLLKLAKMERTVEELKVEIF